jgi:prepilin-type N-terminal cleavage/methylation domain-containing protein
MKKGFTLIELMIVVAIIAFLAMVSIPSFKKFLAKAKRTEAHMNLSSLATAEKIYWAEHGVYSNDLQAIGWEPEGEILYTYGFPGSEGKNYVTGKLGASSSHLSSAKASKEGFVVVAAGDIDGDGEVDIISIDQNKKIAIIKDDLVN